MVYATQSVLSARQEGTVRERIAGTSTLVKDEVMRLFGSAGHDPESMLDIVAPLSGTNGQVF